ncbi:MarR family transcriptional regulator [Sphaerisporangium sp. TRM90804]|uniref:MarR family winged helix-turn-helix transcriptional regulator n=1 Tax=Sphaerisporangium sp. TRM90804 TaxID=3031113 RepID=UPI00244D2D59|nr:MarR family transcriptional regulator [Sphaerisporangium sp. TRM90804]MDH2430569.1 MarR family transcriptional regulator [Sphaerisporangium sp. TRM90804]
MDERDALVGNITQAQHALGRFFAHDRSMPLLALSLTMQQLKVALILAHRGSVSGQELAHALGTGLGTVTGIVDRLVAQGLVARREDPDDRRIRRVELTDAGRHMTEEFADAGLSRFRELLGRLDLDTLRQADHVMRALLVAADELYDAC